MRKPQHKIANFIYIWCLGSIGFLLLLPSMSALYPESDVDIFSSIVIAQGVIFTGIYAAIGSVLSKRIGFNSPLISYLLNKDRVVPQVKKQLIYAIIIGTFGALIMFLSNSGSIFSSYVGQFSVIGRLFGASLYEEIMARWFLMTLLIWIFWCLFERKTSKPSNLIIWAGLVVSNMLFIAGHYPAVSILISDNTEIMIMFLWMFIITVPWGWLYWKFGIESAIVAHAVFHAVFILLS